MLNTLIHRSEFHGHRHTVTCSLHYFQQIVEANLILPPGFDWVFDYAFCLVDYEHFGNPIRLYYGSHYSVIRFVDIF